MPGPRASTPVEDDRAPRVLDPDAPDEPTCNVWVSVSRDGMDAALHVRGPTLPQREDIEAAIAEAGIAVDVDERVIASALLQEGDHLHLARGRDPVPGADGFLRVLPEVPSEGVPPEGEDGRIDFHAFTPLAQVEAGNPVAIVVPPEAGIDGCTVRGEPVAAEAGLPVKVVVGENVTLDEETGVITATRSGLVELDGPRVLVRPVLFIRGDVDFESGSVDFNGDVVVDGSVGTDFKVRGAGRVFVKGDVDQAEVVAGSLVVVQGAVAGERSIVRSGGDVGVRAIVGGSVEAAGSIFVEKEIREARVVAGECVIVEQRSGRIFDATVIAGDSVFAPEVGSKAEAETRIEAGAAAARPIDEETGEPVEGPEEPVVSASILHRRVVVSISGREFPVTEEQAAVCLALLDGRLLPLAAPHEAPRRPDTMRGMPRVR